VGLFDGRYELTGFCSKAQGESHKEKDIPVQDAAVFSLSKSGKSGIAVVADGHGGEKYFRSAKGSELAVSIAKQTITSFELQVRSEKTIAPSLKHLASNIIYQWREKVLEDIQKLPFNDGEIKLCTEKNIDTTNEDDLVSIYGTTLIAAFVTETCWFAVQIGDGVCVSITGDGKAETAIPADERLAFGKTTSLCNTDAIDSFRYNFKKEKVLGITVATDGVADSFIPEKYLDFNKNLMEDFLLTEHAQRNLDTFLPELSRKGSRDDVAIAGLFNIPDCRKFIYKNRQKKNIESSTKAAAVIKAKDAIEKYGHFIGKG